MGVPGEPWHTQILADQLTLFQPGVTDFGHLITTGTPGFLDLLTALGHKWGIFVDKKGKFSWTKRVNYSGREVPFLCEFPWTFFG